MKNDIVPYDDFKEIAIDKFDDIIAEIFKGNSIFENLPFVKIAVGLLKSYNGYAEHRLKRKLTYFLHACKDLDNNEIESFLEKNTHNAWKIGILMLDELYDLDSDQKAILAGRLFKYCVRNNAAIDDYHRILNSISRCYFKDLCELKHFSMDTEWVNDGSIIPVEVVNGLFTVGFLSDVGIDGGGFGYSEAGGTMYTLSKYGKIVSDLLKM